MIVVECKNKVKHQVRIDLVTREDYKKLTKANYFFNWKMEISHKVYKLTLLESDEILGVMSLVEQIDERLEINLLAVSRNNRGSEKKFEGIAGNLIAWACKQAVLKFGDHACVSLVPKTKLRQHYMKVYGMEEAGRSLFLSEDLLVNILKIYKI